MIDLPNHTAPSVSVASLAARYRATIKAARDPAITDKVCAARCNDAAKIARQMAATPAASAKEAAFKLKIAREESVTGGTAASARLLRSAERDLNRMAGLPAVAV